jgi:hypothetical protein
MFCDKDIIERLNHTPILTDIDVAEISGDEILLKFYFMLGNILTDTFYSHTLTEEGVCRTINPITANLFYRDDVVDPEFLKQIQFKINEIEPQHWTMDGGYTPNKIENYPLRAYDNGKINGFNLYVKILEDMVENMDTTCRVNPLDIKIALHHPAEVISAKGFFLVPYNKSVTLAVKPQITRTSDNLKNYDYTV